MVHVGQARRYAPNFAAWAKYFLPGFHPWNIDDRHLIAGFDLAGDYGQQPARKVRGARLA